MKLQVQCTLQYEANSYATGVFSFLAAKTAKQQILSEELLIEPHLEVEELAAATDTHRFVRIEIPEAKAFTINYQATVQTLFTEINLNQYKEPVLVAHMPANVLPYLFPSRYCQSDQLYRFAEHRFGNLETDFAKVLAITDWIYKNVEYLIGSFDSHTAALDTITQQAGVCRDFAHLAIALCRALTIPARYFTCYAFKLNPPDFHACFEAYINGHWLIFDATRLAPLNGLVKIATGRDAADVAVATLFGNISLTAMEVSCQAIDLEFTPFYNSLDKNMGLSY